MRHLKYSVVAGLMLAGLAAQSAAARDADSVNQAPVPVGMSADRLYQAPNPEFSEARAYLAQGQFDLAYPRFERLAAAGDPNAMRELGLMHARGQGRPVDQALAMNWLERAANAGDPRSMLMLGTIHARGIGVPVDKDRAAYWLNQARAHGTPQIKGIASDTLRQL